MTYRSPTTINVSNGIGEILIYLNEVTSFWISRMLMIAIFVIFFMGFLRSKQDEDFLGSWAVGSYACFVVGILFWIIGFLDGVTFGIIIANTLLSSAVLFMDKRGS